MADRESDITRAEVEVFSSNVNAWVIRTPGRAFPALVIQGDSFSRLLAEAEEVLSGLRGISSIDLAFVESARQLRDMLKERLDDYETVLRQHGMPLPYSR
jgi:hypothetical protein